MIVVNKATHGEKAYIVSIGTGTAETSEFAVAAYNETEAVDLVADYIESHGCTGLYCDHAMLKAIAGCTRYKTADDYAEAYNLTCCGNHGIYVELINIQEVA